MRIFLRPRASEIRIQLAHICIYEISVKPQREIHRAV